MSTFRNKLGVALALGATLATPALAQARGFGRHAAAPVGHGPVNRGGGWAHGPRYGYGYHVRPYRSFDVAPWGGGRWMHSWHGGRFGWWWVAGPSWYLYSAPVYPAPNPEVPPDIDPALVQPGLWYWCEGAQAYYPYASSCPSGWAPVQPSAP